RSECRWVGAIVSASIKSRRLPCAEQCDERIDDGAGAVKLNCQIELLALHRGEEAWNLFDERLPLGQPRPAWKLDEAIEVFGKTSDKLVGPRQSDQGNLGMGPRVPQGAQRRDGT